MISYHESFELLRNTWSYKCNIVRETAFYVRFDVLGLVLSLENIHKWFILLQSSLNALADFLCVKG